MNKRESKMRKKKENEKKSTDKTQISHTAQTDELTLLCTEGGKQERRKSDSRAYFARSGRKETH